MSSKGATLTLKSAAEGEWQRITLAGPINEEAKAVLSPLLAQAGKKVVLDLSGVTYLNSCGIRDWSYFLKALKTDREIVFDRLTDEVVRTMNMVTNFYYRLPVRSVYRAYGCEHCGHEQVEQFSEGADYQKGAVPATAPRACKSCGKATEPFEPDEEFFQFLLTA